MVRLIRFVGLLLVCAIGAGGASARAQSAVVTPGEEHIVLNVGAFLPTFETTLRIDSTTGGRGSEVNLSDDLGVDRRRLGVLAGAEWRFARRHRIGVSYGRFEVDGVRTLGRELAIGDRTFAASVEVESTFRADLIPIAYSFSFVKRERHDVAAMVGVHWSRLSFRTQASAFAGGPGLAAEVDADTDVPLPVIGLRYDYHPSDRWSFGANAAAFSLGFGRDTLQVQGTVATAQGYVEYRFLRHLGAGASMAGFATDVDLSAPEWEGALDHGYWGPHVYLKARF